jgi:hypothetical protein
MRRAFVLLSALEVVDGDGTTKSVYDPVASPAVYYTVEVQR